MYSNETLTFCSGVSLTLICSRSISFPWPIVFWWCLISLLLLLSCKCKIRLFRWKCSFWILKFGKRISTFSSPLILSCLVRFLTPYCEIPLWQRNVLPESFQNCWNGFICRSKKRNEQKKETPKRIRKVGNIH